MKRITVFFALFFYLFPLTVIHGGTKFCHVSGKAILSPSGDTLKLKGINLGNWLVPEGYMFKLEKTNSPRMLFDMTAQLIGEDDAEIFWQKYRQKYITEKDIRFIKECGLNSIRVPIHYKLFLNGYGPSAANAEGFRLIDKLLSWCEKAKLYVILDMHCAPGGQTGDNIDDSYGYPFLFESKASQELTVRVWKNIVQRYKAKNIILGYEVLNEPVAHYYDTTALNKKLISFYKDLTSAIRSVDKNHIVILSGAQWGLNFKIFDKPIDKNMVFAFHKYWTAPEQSVIQEYIDYSVKQNVPIWMSESGENSDEWIDTFRVVLDNNKIGWCFWPYKKMAATSCMLAVKMPENYNKVISFAEGLRVTYDDLRKNHIQRDSAMVVLNDVLKNIDLDNCSVNYGFIKALGVKAPKTK
jgi:endoglucanase